jgi:hypothetical protein
MRSSRILLVALGLAATAFYACTDDEADCGGPCPTGRVCGFDGDGVAACLPECGTSYCQDGESCVAGECTVSNTCSPACGASDHCVAGNCIPDYTTSNSCDPLRECRRECGTSVSCLAACDADRSTSCDACLDSLVTCEERGNCTSGPYEFDCCHSDFCECFPSHPACGNVPACQECADEAGDDINVFEECASGEPACSNCLEPIDDCDSDPDPAACEEAVFCDCTECE